MRRTAPSPLRSAGPGLVSDALRPGAQWLIPSWSERTDQTCSGDWSTVLIEVTCIGALPFDGAGLESSRGDGAITCSCQVVRRGSDDQVLDDCPADRVRTPRLDRLASVNDLGGTVTQLFHRHFERHVRPRC